MAEANRRIEVIDFHQTMEIGGMKVRRCRYCLFFYASFLRLSY